MTGFNLSIGSLKLPIQEFTGKDYLIGSISGQNFKCNRFALNKFQRDKIFFENEKYFVILDGVVLNKAELLIYHKQDNWNNLIVQLYESFGDAFFNSFRGSFCGALYDKMDNKWIIFSDHIGSKHIYVSKSNDNLVISTGMDQMYQILKINNLNYQLDEQAAYMLLSYGYMLDDYTLCSEVKKIKPGHYLLIKNGNIESKQYYNLPSEKDESITEANAIEEIDRLFRNAIKLQFDKDREYGYKHFVALSGGLDSRMTSWVAHDMGYTDQLNITFSQSDYLDETIPKKIAADLKHEWIFKALDNGLFLKDIEENNKVTGGNLLYYGVAHGNSIMKYINFQQFGISHSGQLGDVVFGSFIKSLNDYNNIGYQGAYSTKLIKNVLADSIKLNYINLESFLFYQRGFNGANNGLLAIQEHTETLSPFYDIDLLNYCMILPLKYRVNHNVYKKWIILKYPKAADYIWESINAKITAPTITIKGKEIPLKNLFSLVLRKLKLLKKPGDTKHHMNPLEYWYKTNPDIKDFQDSYYRENIERLSNNKQLKTDCENLYYNGNAIEKNQVLTLLSALKLYFNK